MSAGQHIIGSQIVDIVADGDGLDALALHRQVGALCRDWLGPAIEAVFDLLDPGEVHWTIDRLEIDAGSLDLDELDSGFVTAIAAALESRLRDHAVAFDAGAWGAAKRDSVPGRAVGAEQTGAGPEIADRAMVQTSPLLQRNRVEAVGDAFAYFLQTGRLPWWFMLSDGQSLEDAISEALASPEGKAAIIRALAGISPKAALRLARQIAPPLLRDLMAAISSQGSQLVAEAMRKIEMSGLAPDLARALIAALWQAGFTVLLTSPEPHPPAIAVLWLRLAEAAVGPEGAAAASRVAASLPAIGPQRHGPQPNAQTARAARVAAGPEPVDPGAGIHIECAGVVLLHPFLPQLFSVLGIVRDGKIEAADRALAMLHFLASGENSAPEYALFLPKLLCGLALDEPAPAPVILSATDMEEGLALLRAVIGHWTALGDSSVDALRGTFLTRAGKYYRRSNGDEVLQVETQSFDILLDQLPWGLGLIQLPWMARILSVEWGY